MELTPKDKDELIEKLKNASTSDDVKIILKEYSNFELKGTALGIAFETMFVNEKGFSEEIKMDDLEKIHHSYHTTNGGDWCRSNQSYLGKKYNIKRTKISGRIFSIKTDGLNKNKRVNQTIRMDIYKDIISKRCSVLDISSNIECDHKDGMKDDWRLNDLSKQKESDFQPLTKTVNDAKRQHCKICVETGKRYDAKRLGYKESFIYGDEDTPTCSGCYWYDPKEFNQVISENFKKRG